MTTPDGVDLAVREVGPTDAPVTVVFAHGFCMNMGAFHFQRRELARVWGDQVRMVFYDQRGHGKSGTAAPRTYTVAQLGCDLDTVLTVMAPRGSVILVGHSMGGMTVLSHARQFPRRYGTGIVGAAIISSAAEGLSRSPLGEILQNPALEAARFATRYAPNLVHRGRGAVRSVLSPILQAASFGDRAVSPTVARYSEHMIHDTPVTTMVGFLHALGVHDETDGLPVLAKVPTLIACGSADTLTLPEHSEEMAAVLPKCRAAGGRRRRPPGPTGATRPDRRGAGPARRAGHPQQAAGDLAAVACPGAAPQERDDRPWLTRDRRCWRTPRT